MTQTTFTRRVGALACGGGLVLAMAGACNPVEAGGFPSAPTGRVAPSRVSSPPATTAPVVTYSTRAEDWRTVRSVRALDRAILTLRANSVGGGYPGYIRVGTGLNYGKDLHQPLEGSQIRTAHGGTPTWGLLFLEAYHAIGKPEYLLAAREAGRALAWTQNREGGWDLTSDTEGIRPGFRSVPRFDGVTALDDRGGTQGCIEFLMQLDKEISETWLTDAIRDGLDLLIRAQTDEGGWEARYPAKPGSKEALLYFNDGVTNTSIDVLLDAYEQYGTQRYLEAAERGADFIFAARLTGAAAPLWAEQYTHDMIPTWGRPWEAPEASVPATMYNLETFYKLAKLTRDMKYVTPMLELASWLEAHQVGENLWPRYYSIQTGQPVYTDRNGKYYDDWRDIPEDLIQPGALARLANRGVEIRYDVSWGTLPELLDRIEAIREHGFDAFNPPPPSDYVPTPQQVERVRNGKWTKVEPMVAEVERDGGWVLRSPRGRFYSISEFRTGMRQLVDFIQRDPQFPELRRRWAGQ